MNFKECFYFCAIFTTAAIIVVFIFGIISPKDSLIIAPWIIGSAFFGSILACAYGGWGTG